MRLEATIEKALPGFLLQARLTTEAGILVLFGPSGAGKSLTLQCLAGIVRPDRGRIALDDDLLFESSRGVDVPPQQRRIGYVPQDYALFPHLSAAENIAFGLRRWPRAEAEAEVSRLLALLHLTGLERRRPAELSGGQQQRVALARALATRPRLLLLDEPFSALDTTVRDALRADLREVQGQLGVGIVFVTHDLADTAVLADAVAVYAQGQVLQVGPREEVFRRPLSVATARLTGARNLLAGTVTAVGPDGCSVSVGETRFWVGEVPGAVGDTVTLVIRPEQARLLAAGEPTSEDEEVAPAVLRETTNRGQHYVVQVSLGEDGGPVLDVAVPVWWWERFGGRSGARCRVGVARNAIRVLPGIPEPGK